ncbi:MAG: methyltransferase family protein, partial [Vulcanimicrobiaceae bacterium]
MPRQYMEPQALVFKNRGALLALPALLLVVFGKPSTASILLGLPLAFAGEAIRCWAVGYSGTTTRAASVTAPNLVTAGPYAYMRNPLYAGNFVTAVGFALAFTGRNTPFERLGLIAASLGTMLAVYATIVPHEERYLRTTFGARYDEYASRVPRTLPLRAPNGPQHGAYDPAVIASAESRTFVTFGLV